VDSADVVVIGAGVIGLAIAREFALRGREVLLLEAAATFGSEVSARNSEVIHAGLYYPRGSLKARLCVAGRERLYAFCREHGVGHRRCGKLIAAADEAQRPALLGLLAAGHGNGVPLEWLERAAAQALEPALQCAAALHSPETGIVDAHAYMLALLAEAQAHGATLVCRCSVTRMVLEERAVLIGVAGAAPQLRARLVVNCAGIRAPALAQLIEGFPARHIPHAYFVKGSYFALRGRAPFQRLIYPLPEAGGLGVHLTLDLAGGARFGPDVEWVESCDYSVDPQRATLFYAAVRRYWPALEEGRLQPGFAGVRPRISAPGQPLVDFRIDGVAAHGVPTVLNLFGIESPGLTASLALASEAVARAA
jgi:L-2-hydroxyglutarate oxidase LhgO